MERIKIAQVDIDVDALIEKSAEARKRLLEISNEMKSLKDTLDKGNISIDEYAKRLTVLTAEQKIQSNELRVYDNLVKGHIETEAKKTQSNKKVSGSIKELGAALSQNKLIYQQLSEEEREAADVGGKLLAVIQEQDKKYKELQKSIGNNQVDVGNYRQAILDAIGDNSDLGASLNSLTNGFTTLKDKLALVKAPFENYVKYGKLSGPTMEQMSNATNKSATSLKILRGAVISTGIGALVVALGSLIAYFTSTQEGIDKVNKVLTPLKVLFQTLWGVVQNVGKALVEAFTHPKQLLLDLGKFMQEQIINRATAIIDAFKGLGNILTGNVKEGIKQVGDAALQAATGVKDVVGKVKEAGKAVSDTIGEAIKRGQRIEEINQKLSASEADFIEQTAKLKQEFKEQNMIAEDTTKTFAEREAAARKSIEIQKKINKLATDRNDLEQELLNLKFASNDTSDADRAELAKKKAELAEQRTAMVEAVTTQNNKVNTIHKAAADEQAKQRKEASDKAIAWLKQELEWQKEAIEDYVKTNSAVAKSMQERLDIEEKGMQDRLALLDKEKANGLIKQREYERQKRDIEQDYLKVRNELTIEAVQKEAEQYEMLNADKFDTEEALQEAIYQKKVEALEKEKQLKQEMHDWDYNAEEEHQEKLQELKADYQGKLQELKAQQAKEDENNRNAQKEAEKAQRDFDFADKLMSLQEQGATELEIEAEQLRQKHEKEREELDESLDNNKISHEMYYNQLNLLIRKQAKEELDLKKKTEESKLALTQSVLGQIKGMTGEHTALSKAAAIAEATINTYLGVSKAISQGMPMGAVTAAITLAAGMANVQKIVSTETDKYEAGGLIVGKSHASGGVPFTVAGRGGFEAEGGEYIINKRATAMYFPVLEAINKSAGYGSYNPVYMAAGGVIKQPTPVQTDIKELKIDFDKMMNAIKEGAMQGTLQGAQAGAYEGARAGSLEGAMQGAYEGATLGTTTGLTESALRISDNEFAKRSASI
ncbi:chromosome segregation ATPase [Capnocytophaga leadbetteri]|uniref:chromosome segregation ATPase n=1 Tax=Capnocytophaga leadbetteri TaxID=327575 RepID=UPI0028F011F6|nr:chromosome segregation ATPase [Capnocytophaga leadbetteri]